MIQYLKRSLTLGDNSEELLSEESGGLPFLCYFDESRLFTGNHIPWHWHDRIELNYVEEGTFRFHSPDVEFEAGPGEVVFINRNIMHAYDFPAPVNYYSYTFDSRFLAGEFGGYIDRKYFAPILRSKSLSVVHLKPDTAHRIRMSDHILQLTELLRDEPEGYELAVREVMSRFFLLLRKETEEVRAAEQKGNERDLDRMKQMLQFIYAHYGEPIGLDRNLTGTIDQTTGYAKKTAVAVTSFAPAEYGPLVAQLAKTDDNKVKRSVASPTLVCNLVDYLTKVMPATTAITDDGRYVGDLFPVPTKVVTSEFIEAGKAVLFLADEYDLLVGGNRGVEYSDDYQFLEDNRVFKIVQYAYGLPRWNTSALVLNISGLDPAYITVKVEGTVKTKEQS